MAPFSYNKVYLTSFEAIEVKSFLKVWLPTLKKKDRALYDKLLQSSDLFVFFIVPQRLTLVGNAKRKLSKSNKSELWNHLSCRSLPYFFEVGSQILKNDYKILRSQPKNSTAIILWPQWPRKKHFEISLKSMHFFQILIEGRNCRWRLH